MSQFDQVDTIRLILKKAEKVSVELNNLPQLKQVFPIADFL